MKIAKQRRLTLLIMSIVIGVSRNVESKPRLMPAIRAMVRNTRRLLASRNVNESGILTPEGRSSPSGGMSRARSMIVSSAVLPSRATAILVRS